ncbi:phenylacetate--CoA ligase family protein [Neobacillus sp. SM06]|uniref:phenylacetate--CoA ligase family protein n=1 Tax=Neobacillus sp. SM06 TaxID=3422492 RepID=UPI003D296ED4
MQYRPFIDAALKSRFYQEKLAGQHFENWLGIPFTTKTELRNADAYDLIGTAIDQIATYHETSGTTGTPTPSWFTHKDIEQEVNVVLNSSLQLNEKDLVLNRFPFAMAIPSFIFYWSAARVGAGHIAVDKASMITPDRRVVEIIERTNPSILTMLPSEAEKLYEVGKQMGVLLPNPNLRAFVLAGELMTPSRKKHLENVWGVPVYLLFGSTETGGLFMSCENGHYHLNHANAFVESVDENGKPAKEGLKGNCVISTAREGMPLLRYANQDIIELRAGSTCGCGQTKPIMIHYGRKEDLIRMPNDREITFYDLQEVVYSLKNVPFMWKVKVLTDHVQFMFQYTTRMKPSRKTLEEEISTKLGLAVEVVFTEIFSLQKLTEKPAYAKYAHIERETKEWEWIK